MTAPPYPLPGPVALRGNLMAALGEAEASPEEVRGYRRAWALTAAGRYGEALKVAGEVVGRGGADAAAVLGVRAHVLRAVGLPGRAEEDDRAGLALVSEAAGGLPAAIATDVEAGLRVGLVADHVARSEAEPRGAWDVDGSLAEAQAAVARLRREASAAPPAASLCGVPWRQVIRLGWVEGMTALARNEPGHAGRAFAHAHRLAAARGARAHEARTMLFLAQAKAAAGDLATAAQLAGHAASLAEACGAQPLVWRARLLLADAAEARGAGRAAHAQRERAQAIRDRLFASLPKSLRHAVHGAALT